MSRELILLFFILQSALKHLKKIHKKDITHQDIKLENMLFNHRCEIVIADYGFSFTGNHIPKFCGTVGYFSPEQFFETLISKHFHREIFNNVSFRNYSNEISATTYSLKKEIYFH